MMFKIAFYLICTITKLSQKNQDNSTHCIYEWVHGISFPFSSFSLHTVCQKAECQLDDRCTGYISSGTARNRFYFSYSFPILLMKHFTEHSEFLYASVINLLTLHLARLFVSFISSSTWQVQTEMEFCYGKSMKNYQIKAWFWLRHFKEKLWMGKSWMKLSTWYLIILFFIKIDLMGPGR